MRAPERALVLASIEDGTGDRCVDILRRGGTHGWVECRRDPEDPHGWRRLAPPEWGHPDRLAAHEAACAAIGWLRHPVRVVPHDPAWAGAYAAEAARLGPHLPGAVLHHIGSTAVLGLAAKPTIDLLAEVPDLAAVAAPPGYAPMTAPGPRRLGFRRVEGGRRTHHLHVVRTGDPDVRRHLAFRDVLRARLDEAAAYGALKARLAALHPHDRRAYIEGKAAYVKALEARALEEMP
ncbi:MAG: GrpB family protein [Hasllibacter sp.]